MDTGNKKDVLSVLAGYFVLFIYIRRSEGSDGSEGREWMIYKAGSNYIARYAGVSLVSYKNTWT